MRKIIRFSAGNKFAQLTLSDGEKVQFRVGDDWDVYASQVTEARSAKEVAESALADVRYALECERQSHLMAAQAKRAEEAEAAYLEMCQLHEEECARHMRRLKQKTGCINHWRERAKLAEVKLWAKNNVLADEAIFNKLNGHSVVFNRKTLPGNEVLVDHVTREDVRMVILHELGIALTTRMIEFENKSELGVWDAWIGLPGHMIDRARIKVWIIKEGEPIKPDGCGTCANDLTVCSEREPNPCEGCTDGSKFTPRNTIILALRPIIEMIHNIAGAVGPGEGATAMRQKIRKRCNALLGE